MNKKEYDSSDDEDYVPSQDDKESEEKQESEPELTGIEALKERKRNREVDDLFELMNQEDPFYIKPSQRPRLEPPKPKLAEEDETFAKALQAIKDMKAKKAMTTDRVTFAGAKYDIERQRTDKDARKEIATEKRKIGGACEGLDELVTMIGDKDKNVNCMQKTRMDWDKHTKDEKLEAQLEQNRKNGFLVKQKFLEKVSEREYEHKKQVERANRKALLMAEEARKQ